MNSLPSRIVPMLRSCILVLLASALAFVAGGCRYSGKPSAEPEVPRPEQVLDFKTLYSQHCAACHGANGRDGAAIALNNPTYLAIAGVQNIERVTANGVPNTAMPPFGKQAGGMLTDQQIQIISQGMMQKWGQAHALDGQNPPPYAPSGQGNAQQGQKAFAQYCGQCHGADGSGARMPNGNSMGSIVDPAYLALVSNQGLRSIILAGQFENTPHDWRSYQGGHPISDQDATDIVAWLASHRTATPGQPYAPQP